MAKKFWKVSVFVMILTTLSSCKITINSAVKVSSLRFEKTSSSIISIKVLGGTCVDKIGDVVCKNGEFSFEVPMLNKHNIGKIKGERFGFYYGNGKNLIIFISGDFLKELKKNLVKYEIEINTLKVKLINDTGKDFSFGVSGVWVDGFGAVGHEIEFFTLDSGAETSITLSSAGVHSLLRGGVEPVIMFSGD